MKNSKVYRKNERKIKEISEGVWRCQLSPVKGLADIPPMEVKSTKAAMDWLHAGPDKLLPNADIPAAIRAKIKARSQELRKQLQKAETKEILRLKNRGYKKTKRRRKIEMILRKKLKNV
jgi:beta-glucosidase-like glycosyl hydrolase